MARNVNRPTGTMTDSSEDDDLPEEAEELSVIVPVGRLTLRGVISGGGLPCSPPHSKGGSVKWSRPYSPNMDFSFTAEQKQITEMVAKFVDEEVVPVADEVDANDEFPWDLVGELLDQEIGRAHV